MFEITYEDRDLLEDRIGQKKAYAGGQYDFTFEGRFLVYHCRLANRKTYLALDTVTGRSSKISGMKDFDPSRAESRRDAVPAVLGSLRYLGDGRYDNLFAEKPLELIESIFRTVLPEFGYAVRPEQIRLARDMYLGLTSKTAAVCEAGVGSGKTLAYLVAGIVARHHNQLIYDRDAPVTVTTSSIELQRTLNEKEIPRLSEILMSYHIIRRPIRSVLRKGKEHYFCYRRYADFCRNLERHPPQKEAVGAQWNRDFSPGSAFDLDTCGLRPSIRDRICVKNGCSGCPYTASCRYAAFVKNTRKDLTLDFQITNHNLYLTAMKLRREEGASLLQKSNYVIIDEAHKFRDAAESVFGVSLAESEIGQYLTQVRHLCAHSSDRARYREALRSVQSSGEQLFASFRERIREQVLDDFRGIRILPAPREEQLLRTIAEEVRKIEKTRKTIPNGLDDIGAELQRRIGQLQKTGQNSLWLEEDENRNLRLCAAPKNIGKILYETVWCANPGHLMTSGTMSDGESFDYFLRETGLSYIGREFLSVCRTDSPFDYREHTRLYIPGQMPFPCVDSADYLRAIAHQILTLTDATNGHTAILFTSYKVLSAVYDMTKDALDRFELFRMTRADPGVIGRFQKSRNGILFASGPIWEGVDCVGDCLSSVIIPRLPFPIRSALLEQKKETVRGTRAFIETYAVPEMLIKLRQGIGRLIRGEEDTGLVAILDSRAKTGPYAERVRTALCRYPEVGSPEEIRAFFGRVKPKSYFDIEEKRGFHEKETIAPVCRTAQDPVSAGNENPSHADGV